ncbi:general substrate transporter [Auriculariales sp. MPI-PUGE-AT-0066]|nr:general substrate transporter [Auriculariales sp. MPI-PUGE-AT-0066]
MLPTTPPVRLSRYAVSVLIPWALITPMQFGNSIAAFNQISKVVQSDIPGMNVTWFSFVTSIFTIGGLLGSLFANQFLDRYGRRGATRLNALLMVFGNVILYFGNSAGVLAFGRFVNGVAAGVGLCTTPVFLDEISPPNIRGRVGVFNQIGVVFGILVTQGLGLYVAQLGRWREVPGFSAALALAQLLLSRFVVDTPVWLRHSGRENEAHAVIARIWVKEDEPRARLDPEADSVVDRLLDETEQSTIAPGAPEDPTHRQPPVSVVGALKAKDLRLPLAIVLWAMAAQQLCGINAVMYYSNEILGRAVPDAVQWISLGVALVNALMTLPAVVLVEKMGRRNLLILSATGILASLLVVAFGMDSNRPVASSVGVMVFVAAFAIGLGPVPFILIPEVAPYHGVSALSSLALSINWIINFFVGQLFLPLSKWLSDDRPDQAGRVFYLFAAVFFVSFVALLRVYKA